jgi:hypothetical protein
MGRAAGRLENVKQGLGCLPCSGGSAGFDALAPTPCTEHKWNVRLLVEDGTLIKKER